MHHGDDDVSVRAEGCCAGSAASEASRWAARVNGGDASDVEAAGRGESCCCGISERYAGECVSVEWAFRKWAIDVNGGDGEAFFVHKITRSLFERGFVRLNSTRLL